MTSFGMPLCDAQITAALHESSVTAKTFTEIVIRSSMRGCGAGSIGRANKTVEVSR